MYTNAAIEVFVEDDIFNSPDAKKIARTIIVKIPRGSSFKTMVQTIAENYPDIMDRVVMLYYYAKNGKQDPNYLLRVIRTVTGKTFKIFIPNILEKWPICLR